jgi:hypothetical protein
MKSLASANRSFAVGEYVLVLRVAHGRRDIDMLFRR